MDLALGSNPIQNKSNGTELATTQTGSSSPYRRNAQVSFQADLRLVSWADPLIDQIGYDPRSNYVEHFWLPVLGPSSIWLLRRAGFLLEMYPGGIEIPAAFLASSLGLGDAKGTNSLLLKTLQRCVDFEVARQTNEGTFAFRRKLAPLTVRQLSRLPKALADSHPTLSHSGTEELDKERKRAYQLARTLFNLGEGRSEIELQLCKWNFDPNIAAHAVSLIIGSSDS